jgi:hypothetical protein
VGGKKIQISCRHINAGRDSASDQVEWQYGASGRVRIQVRVHVGSTMPASYRVRVRVGSIMPALRLPFVL